MTTPARILRAIADRRDTDRPPMTERQQIRHLRILTLSQAIFAEAGRQNITFGNMATALRMTAATLRWHFADLDALLALLIRRHLTAIIKAMAHIPRDDPNRQRKRRAAYLAFTRNPDGTLTEAHRLLVHQTRHLPDDERLGIEQRIAILANTLAGNRGAEALTLLDCETLSLAAAESALAALKTTDLPAQPTIPLISPPPSRDAPEPNIPFRSRYKTPAAYPYAWDSP